MRITSDMTLDVQDDRFNTIDPNGGAITITLPDAGQCLDEEFVFKVIRGSSGTVTIITSNGQSIDRQASFAMGSGDCLRLRSDNDPSGATNTGWLVLC
jgi:hypothetical protein